MVKILHVTSSLDGGGIATLLYNYCSRMTDECFFDFAITSKSKGFIEKKLENLGFNIFHIPRFKKNPIKHLSFLKKIIRSGKYDVVHDHSDYKSVFTMIYAKKMKVKVRIAHCHLSYVPENFIKKLYRNFFNWFVKKNATNLFACSIDAGRWAWKKTPFYVMKNAIDIEKFTFNKKFREAYRNELLLNDDIFLIGNVGRLTYQKNHEFLIDIFAFYKKLDAKSKLIIVGEGELFNTIKNKIYKMNLEKDVLLLGTRDDVPSLMNAFDAFVLPTRFEGLGIVFIEAQCNGLPCFGTKERVPKEAIVSNNYFSISELCSADEWAKTIFKRKLERNNKNIKAIIENGYDIDTQAKELKDMYKRLCVK